MIKRPHTICKQVKVPIEFNNKLSNIFVQNTKLIFGFIINTKWQVSYDYKFVYVG